MGDDRWIVPQTEVGLQTLLSRLAESRAVGDDAAVGRGLLALAWLVKWVRSDNDEPPFVRAVTLANEALAIFRRIGDVRGQLAALQETSLFIPPEETNRRHEEAMRLAHELGDELALGRTLAARSRIMWLEDQEAIRLAREALEIFLRHDAQLSAAATLFTLAVRLKDPREKYAAAVDSAQRYRGAGELKHASFATAMATWSGEKFLSWLEMESVIRPGLSDAVAVNSREGESALCRPLAKVAAAKGDVEEAAKYLGRWDALKSDDDLTPAERCLQANAMIRTLVHLARTSGISENVLVFEAELKRLRRTRPDRY